MSTKYMFISARRYTSPLHVQLSYAKNLDLDRGCIFGSKQPLYSSCRAIEDALDIADFLLPGDHVYVYNLAGIAVSHKKVSDVITAFHRRGISLHIVDISYNDVMECKHEGIYTSVTDDFRILTNYLREFARIQAKRDSRKASDSHRGRGKPRMLYADVPDDVKKLISRYVMDTEKKYSLLALEADIRRTGYTIGRSRLYRYIDALRAQRGLTPKRRGRY